MIYISLLCLLVGFPLSKKEKIYKNIPGNELAENKNFYLYKNFKNCYYYWAK